MVPVNYTAIIVATITAFLFSAIYYTILNKKIQSLRRKYTGRTDEAEMSMGATKIVIEFTRTFVVGLAMAYAVVNAQTIVQAMVVVAWLWIAFPVVLLTGSVIHERVPAALAAIHAFDWLVKLSLFAVILTLWQ